MTGFKTTKRALISSVIALFLCFSMLLGTTFAWFTDSVTSSGNVIQSGTLDVTMDWADGTKAVPADDSDDWKDASAGAIFKNDLWEPGYVEVRHVRISNVGTLALKYRLSIAANGEVSDLADVIDVYYVDPAIQVADRTVLTEDKKIGTLTSVLENLGSDASTATGELLAGESVTVTLALKMQETAANNYQDKAIGSDFSLILMATQENYEKDSFDENYDDIEIPEMDVKNVNGVTFGQSADGQLYMISVDDKTLTSFTVDENVTILGTGNGKDDNDRVFGKNAPLASLTLPEGLTEIKDNALNALPNLSSVNLPSTLKTIGIHAFRMTGMSELTIPANVETVKLGAFRDMANLTSVTVEGNVTFDEYAFRTCPNLTSIYLLGDDVKFSGSQFATRADSGDANGITIYVKNATVAARVYAAQSSAYGYEVKILGEQADGSDAASTSKVANDTGFDAAVIGGDAMVVLGNGNYSLPDGTSADLRGKELTIIGTRETVIDVASIDANDQFVTGAELVFEGVTLNFGTANYMGFANTKNLVYRDCQINGLQFLYGENVVFENCDLNSNGAEHCVWTYGVRNVSFTGCEFTYGDRGINCYSDNDVVGGKQTVSFTDCEFITANTASAGAVEINSTYFSVGIEVTLEGCTAPDYGELAYVSPWDGTNGAKTTITVK